MRHLIAVVVLVIVACACRGDAQDTVANGGWTNSTLSIDSSIMATVFNLDKQPMVYCDGLNPQTKQPFGCHQDPDWSISVLYENKPYDVTRLDLRRALALLQLKPRVVKGAKATR